MSAVVAIEELEERLGVPVDAIAVGDADGESEFVLCRTCSSVMVKLRIRAGHLEQSSRRSARPSWRPCHLLVPDVGDQCIGCGRIFDYTEEELMLLSA